MANQNLNGLNVAILDTDGFEWVELVEPRKALDEAGTDTKLVSPKSDRVRGGISRIGMTSFPSTSRSSKPGRKISTRCIFSAGS